ncbi:hypothetical protein, partial [Methylogaea oryzae]
MSHAPHTHRPQADQALQQTRSFWQGIAASLLLCAVQAGPVQAAVDYPDAERVVKNQSCKSGETVDQFLDHKLKPSHRDLGWRVFARDGGYDVERAFLASKSMELRYRWRVSAGG